MMAAASHALRSRVLPLTPGRRVWLNVMEMGNPQHRMLGLIEVDVTLARERIAADAARTGEALSFTGFLIGCMARAIEENKEVQGYRKGRRKVVVFDDVNVGMMIEHGGGLMGHVIEHANEKSCREIHDEIRAIQSAPVPSNRGMPSWLRRLMLLPWPLIKLVQALIRMWTRRDPAMIVAKQGTTFVSAIGMFGKGHAGWGISPSPHSLSVLVGGVARKPAVVGDRVEPREILDLTLAFDHEVIDGAPATRFARRLMELVESGYGLPS